MIEPTTAIDGATAAQAAIARRSSTRAIEQVLAQVEQARPERRALGLGAEARRGVEAAERADEHRQLEVGLRDALRRDGHAGAGQDRLPVDELRRARLAVPRPPLGLVGLELEQVAAERRLEAGERGLDTVRCPPQRCLRAAPA